MAFTNPSGNLVLSDSSASCTINKNDTYSISISDASPNPVTEGDGAQTFFTVSLNEAVMGGDLVSVDYAMANDSAVAGNDYAAFSGALATITKGPYLQNSTQHSVVIMWETDLAYNDTLHWGTSESLGSSITDSDATRFHQHTLTSLEKETTYFYKVDS